MTRLAFSTTALRELDDILKFISIENPRAAVALVERIINKCENLARFPNSGMLDEGLGRGIRVHCIEKYVIYSRSVGEGVRIESIRHGSRDIGGLYFEP
jgi:toxin ParE1/3/4